MVCFLFLPSPLSRVPYADVAAELIVCVIWITAVSDVLEGLQRLNGLYPDVARMSAIAVAGTS